ncbi:hypothetical protein ABPG75_007778 [Micractinium tetrahymenae]
MLAAAAATSLRLASARLQHGGQVGWRPRGTPASQPCVCTASKKKNARSRGSQPAGSDDMTLKDVTSLLRKVPEAARAVKEDVKAVKATQAALSQTNGAVAERSALVERFITGEDKELRRRSGDGDR